MSRDCLYPLACAAGADACCSGRSQPLRILVLIGLTAMLALLDAQSSTPCDPATGSLTAEQVRSYRYHNTGGKFFQLVIEQGDRDFAVDIFDPKGQLLANRDWRWNGTESASILAPSTGIYRFEVRLASPIAGAATFTLRCSEPRDKQPQDDALISAEAVSTEVKALAASQDRKSLALAAQKAANSVELWTAAQDTAGLAQAHNTFGFVLNALGKHSEAREQYTQALRLRERAKDQYGQAETLHNIAAAHSTEGQRELAVEYYQRSLKIRKEIGDKAGMAATLSNLASIHIFKTDYDAGIDYGKRAVDMARVAGDPITLLGSLLNLAAASTAVSELQAAIDLYQEAAELIERKNPRSLREEAVLANNVAYLYAQMDQHHRAIELQEKALTLLRKLPEPRTEVAVLANRASSLLALGRAEEALKILEDVVTRCRSLKDESREAASLVNLGRALERMGRLIEAGKAHEEALALARKIDDLRVQASALHNIGVVRFRRGASHAALESLDAALGTWKRLGIRVFEAPTRMLLAQVRRESGELKQALAEVEDALALVEQQRVKVAAEEIRSSYFSGKQDYYRFYIDLLMQLHDSEPEGGFGTKALEASERSRARALLDLMAERFGGIRRGADPELLGRRRSLGRQLNAKANLLHRLTTENAAVPRNRLLQEIDQLHSQIRVVDSQIRARSPRYADLTQPLSFHLTQLQAELDTETVLVEYSLGTSRSFAWAVTATGVQSFLLPSAKEIESLARPLLNSISSHPEAGNQNQSAASLALSQKILAPVASRLGAKRLIVVPDGILYRVSFAGLADPAQRNTVPLVAYHELAQIPSAAVLSVLRQELQQRQPSPRLAIVFANPVFDASDARIRSAVRVVAGDSNTRDAVLRLLYSEQEADAVVSLGRARGVDVFSGFDASLEKLRTRDLRPYRYIHFATHARLHEERPELSSLIFSLVDREGRTQNGYLTLLDIYNLNLAAEMVVLSACETAAGQERKGEGPISLARGFFYAGAPRVVATLWKVDDQATAHFMRFFYQAILHDGLTPAAALRTAQNRIRRDPRWTSPFYWAGFVLYGEWR